jgi:KUP system potassium uptake protein
MDNQHGHNKLSVAGLLITLGIIYGDIGTSPLYVLKAIIGEAADAGTPLITADVVLGGVSCIFWTLTLQTTIKYVWLTLNADNNGEGGIFSLYALVRRRAKWLVVPAILGGSALLADGVITPPLSVASAVEGLRILNPEIKTIPIILVIISAIFIFQSFGTSVVGKAFGPLMLIWFTMLATLGLISLVDAPEMIKSLNPYYAYNLLVNFPHGFWFLGAVFLCTTGAEALYSDLGHCGKENIRYSWIFVKTTLILNYLGQGAWLLQHVGEPLNGVNPFFAIMPDWFLYTGITIATVAAIIASQALISGAFTLISEAVRLNLWPKVKLVFPSNMKGQLYVPSINGLLWLGCLGVLFYFEESSNMEAAYGLAITLTMLMTTLLLGYYLLYRKGFSFSIVIIFVAIYLLIEGAFFVANLRKFSNGGWVSLVLVGSLALVMYIWLRANQIKTSVTEYSKIDRYVEPLKMLSADMTITKYATHLVYMTGAEQMDTIESKVMFSIFEQNPKRADIYWFVHVDTTDEPYTMEYKVETLAKDDVYRVTFRLGFRVDLRINLFFKKVIDEMAKNKEVDITSRYASLREQNTNGDFKFVVLEKFLSYENEFPPADQFIMETYFLIKGYTATESQWFGLDSSSVVVEKVPMVLDPVENVKLLRVK